MSRSKFNPKLSVIVATYNEQNCIVNCVKSLLTQSYRNFEINIIDDGSTDSTKNILTKFLSETRNKTIKINITFCQHKGPGESRNEGAKNSRGSILVFLDADMTFDNNFLRKLIEPLKEKKVIGSDSQEEYLFNPENAWAYSWNIGRYVAAGQYQPKNLLSMVPDKNNYGGIYRSIRKSNFSEVKGFEPGGDYTDDETLVKKLNRKASLAKGAIFYHRNPDNLWEVWHRARWIGKSIKYRKNIWWNLVKFSIPISLAKALFIAFKFRYPFFMVFKITYDLAVWTSLSENI